MNGTEKNISAWGYVSSWAVLKRSLTIAFIVGCLLSLTNQMDVILREPLNARLGAKIVMNFVIPFVVSSVSALLNRKGQ
jgi:hypothetical protein